MTCQTKSGISHVYPEEALKELAAEEMCPRYPEPVPLKHPIIPLRVALEKVRSFFFLYQSGWNYYYFVFPTRLIYSWGRVLTRLSFQQYLPLWFWMILFFGLVILAKRILVTQHHLHPMSTQCTGKTTTYMGRIYRSFGWSGRPHSPSVPGVQPFSWLVYKSTLILHIDVESLK